MRMRHLNDLLIVAILITSTSPLYAQLQQNVGKLKSDARNAVGTIGGDKSKTKIYCQIISLERQYLQAISDKDRKKAEALGRQIDQFRKQLPEEIVLINILRGVDLNSPDGQEIFSIIQSLNQSCPD